MCARFVVYCTGIIHSFYCLLSYALIWLLIDVYKYLYLTIHQEVSMSDNTSNSSSENQNTAKLKELVKLPENEQYLFLLKSVPNDAERIRIGLILDYYIKNANKNRKCHRLFSSLGVIIPALATFVSAAPSRVYPAT